MVLLSFSGSWCTTAVWSHHMQSMALIRWWWDGFARIGMVYFLFRSLLYDILSSIVSIWCKTEFLWCSSVSSFELKNHPSLSLDFNSYSTQCLCFWINQNCFDERKLFTESLPTILWILLGLGSSPDSTKPSIPHLKIFLG